MLNAINSIRPILVDSFCGLAICPREILMLIFSYLTQKELGSASCTCHEFKDISESISAMWLQKLSNATAIILGDDKRGKKPDQENLEISSYLVDYLYKGISLYFTHLFVMKEEIFWHVSQLWIDNKKDQITNLTNFCVFYIGNPYTLKVKPLPSTYFLKMKKTTNNDSLIGLKEDINNLNIFKFAINKSEINITQSSFKEGEYLSPSLKSSITSEGLLAVGEQLPTSFLITIYDCITETISSSIEVSTKDEINSLSGIELFSRNGENYLAAIYRINKSCFLSIFSCKDQKELSRKELLNEDFRHLKYIKLMIDGEKMAITSVYSTQVIDLKTMEIIFDQSCYFEGLHRNKLIVSNKENENIEIYSLFSPPPIKPILIPIELGEEKSWAISDDLLATISGLDIKLFKLKTGEPVSAFSTAKIDNPGIPKAIFFEMRFSDSYLCVILDDSRVIYYSTKDLQNPNVLSHDT